MKREAPIIRYTKRWFCYLDLLGFTQFVQNQTITNVLPLYEKVLSKLSKATFDKSTRGIGFSWFSDTFIIYSRGETAEDFSLIEQAGRLFFQSLIMYQIAVRGAISFGDLYTQQERNIFIGPALIDAYRYGEGQDWLGFILAPSVVKQLAILKLSVQQRPYYHEVVSAGVLKPGIDGPVFAYGFNNAQLNGKNPYIEPLRAMKLQAGQLHWSKYDRTIAFINGINTEWPK